LPQKFELEFLSIGAHHRDHLVLEVTDVCFESGFNNLSNFNRRFQQLKGMTPSDYRRLVVQRLTEQNLG
ncbi:MAG: helix-turn-helix domain-containing protein, partial [Pseudomonadota bacterium]